MSAKEKKKILEAFKGFSKDVQMALIAGKALAELEKRDQGNGKEQGK